MSALDTLTSLWETLSRYLPASVVENLFTAKAAIAFVLLYVTQKLLFRKKNNADRHYIVDEPKEELKWTYLGKDRMPDLDGIPILVNEMRQSYNTGYSRPLWKRKQELQKIHDMFVNHEKDIAEALRKDLGRPEFEATVYDIMIPLNECKHLIANLDAWSSPEKKGMNLLTFPSSNYIYKEPKGLVLVIGTWNYPIMLTMVPIMGAIAAGNTVLVKPCNVSSNSAKLIAELIQKYLDPRIVSVVGTNLKGDRHATAKLLHSQFDHIFFTGSPAVGKVIARGAAEFLTPVTLELGGKNPVFIDSDADLDLAAKRTLWGRNMNGGQQCISPDYVLVHEKSLEKFEARLQHWQKTLYGKDPRQTIGRIVGDSQMKRVVNMLETSGGKVIAGGKYDMEERYMDPTVVRISKDSPAMVDETFGPILWIVPIKNIKEGIDHVNSNPKPLSLYIFTKYVFVFVFSF